MFSKLFIAPIFLLALTSSVNAHAVVAPALGVKGNPARSDVQRPSQAKPCGNVNIAQNLDTSTVVSANAKGIFVADITGFDSGADGSRSIKAVQLDTSGTGNHFFPAQLFTNGDPNPAAVGTQELSVQIPAGIKCTGGTSKNLCLASFTTTAGFGNCVVVSQGAGAAGQTTPVNGAAKGIRAKQEHVDAAHKSPDKKGGGSKKDDTTKNASKKNNVLKTGETPTKDEKTYAHKKNAAIKNENVSKKGDASKNIPSKRADASKKTAVPTNAAAQPAPKNPAPISAPPQRPTKHKTTVPEKSITPKKKVSPKKDEKEKGNTHKRNWSSRKLVMWSMN